MALFVYWHDNADLMMMMMMMMMMMTTMMMMKAVFRFQLVIHLWLLFLTGSVVGNRICAHPDVRKLGFTGSTETGKSIMERYPSTCTHLLFIIAWCVPCYYSG